MWGHRATIESPLNQVVESAVECSIGEDHIGEGHVDDARDAPRLWLAIWSCGECDGAGACSDAWLISLQQVTQLSAFPLLGNMIGAKQSQAFPN